MNISARDLIENASAYLKVFQIALAWKGSPGWVQAAVAVLEKAVEYPMARELIIKALEMVPGFNGVGDTESPDFSGELAVCAGMEADFFQLSKALHEGELGKAAE